MPQNATEKPLSPAQEAALAALLSGLTVTAAAQAARADRSTIYRWQREPAFAAAYAAGRRELMEATATRLLVLAERAVGAVERALDAGDARVALSLLKGLGVLAGQTPTDVAEVQRQAAGAVKEDAWRAGWRD